MLYPSIVMGTRERVLVVDDDGDSREVLSLVLADAGYTVETARNAPEAMEKISTFSADLVLSDLQMPGMSGLELIRALRARGDAQPVILLTGAETKDLCTSAQAYGAAACLSKPANLEELVWEIDCAMACARTPATERVRVPRRRQESKWAHV